MSTDSTRAGTQPGHPHTPLWQRAWLRAAVALLVVCAAVLLLGGEYLVRQAEPILRSRITTSLAARFGEPVALDRLHISLLKGVEVEGYGLRLPLLTGDGSSEAPYPLLAVRYFAFRTTFRGLFRQPTQLAAVEVDGMELHIPPPALRRQLFRAGGRTAQGNGLAPSGISLRIQELHCRDVQLFLHPASPGKLPLQFRIATLDLRDLARTESMTYDAQLTNPKPVGALHVNGHVGPWGGIAATALPATPDPGQTPLDGTYTFQDADLRSIRGLGGTLSSTGRFSGVLSRLTLDGHTDTPDFSLSTGRHAVPLHTTFHALVDATSGNIALQPVSARLAGSDLTVSGSVLKATGGGHDLRLHLTIPHGRVQDFLWLATRSDPALMNGTLTLDAMLRLPPGERPVPQRLHMAGSFHLTGVRFNNPRLQGSIDRLSARAQGRPGSVTGPPGSGAPAVPSQLAANLVLDGGVMAITGIHYAVPGALVQMNGVYSLDGRLFEFKGDVRTGATVSQMVGGWKGSLLRPFDSVLQRQGAGAVVPLTVSGTADGIHLGLALNGTADSPQHMLAEVQAKSRAEQQLRSARHEAALADADDARAARATSLQAALQAHQDAVRHRAAAQKAALSAREPAAAPPR